MNFMCAGLVGGTYNKTHNQSVVNGDFDETASRNCIFQLQSEVSLTELELQASQSQSFRLIKGSKLNTDCHLVFM